VRHRPKYNLPGKKRTPPAWWTWFATGLCLGLLGWLLWKFIDSGAQKRPPKQNTGAAQYQGAVKPAKPGPSESVRKEEAPPARLPPASTVVSNGQAAARESVRVSTNPPASTNVVGEVSPLRSPSNVFPRPPETPLEAQVALARLNLSPGSIDGNMGPQTRAALRAFQNRMGLPETGQLDDLTRSRLILGRNPLCVYLITAEDLARLQPLDTTWLGKSRQTALEFESLPELLGELSRASPTLIRRLNPEVRWREARPGTAVELPDILGTEPVGKAGFVTIRLRDRVLQAVDGEGLLVAHFPCSIASRVEKRPVGELRVQVIVPNPNYTFDPDVFPESEEGRRLGRKLILPPGPNNPVGVAWIGLDRPGYGIHGTPNPEQVGRTESHGCFRLANWNAALLLRMAWIGMPVRVEP